MRNLLRNYKIKNLSKTTFTKDKIVLITGGCLGIGNEIIKSLLKNFECVIINLDIREELFVNNDRVFNFKCDLSIIEQINQVFIKIFKQFPNIDFLINNAGVAFNKKFQNLTQNEFVKTIEVNLMAPMILTKKVIDNFNKTNSNENNNLHVVNISSVMSHLTSTKSSDYISSKWGLFGFHESIRYDYFNQTNILFTVICPFAVDTGMFVGFKPPISFIPLLKADIVVEQILNGIILHDKIIFVPFYIEYVVVLFRLLPVCIRDFIHFYFMEKSTLTMNGRNDNSKLLKLE